MLGAIGRMREALIPVKLFELGRSSLVKFTPVSVGIIVPIFNVAASFLIVPIDVGSSKIVIMKCVRNISDIC